MGYGATAQGDYSFAINLNLYQGPQVGANTFQISGASSIGGNTGWSELSDKRLKKDIQDLGMENNLEKIMKLNGVRFKWKESNPGNDRFYLGFLAQDLLEILPEPVLHDELNDIYSIEYTAIIPVLVEAIKEQQQIIEKQQQANEEIKTQLQLLSEEIDTLKAKYSETEQLKAVTDEVASLKQELELLKAIVQNNNR